MARGISTGGGVKAYQILEAGFRTIEQVLDRTDNLADKAAAEAAHLEQRVRDLTELATSDEAPVGTLQAIAEAHGQVQRLRMIAVELINGGAAVREQIDLADRGLDPARQADDTLAAAGAGGRIVGPSGNA